MANFYKNSIRKWILNNYGLDPVLRTLRSQKDSSNAIVAVSFRDRGSLEQPVLEHLKLHSTKQWPSFVVKSEIAPSTDQWLSDSVHLHLDGEKFTANVLETFIESVDGFGRELNTGSKENILVDYSSPNIAKPFHYGHLRSTILGNFIANLNAYLGHNVTRINYLGDWGTQFGLLSLGFELYGNEEKLLENACKHLLDVYVRINEECEKNANLRDTAKERFLSLENGSSPELLAQWTRFREYSIENYKLIYERMGIGFDEMHSESMYSGASLMVINKLLSLGLLQEQDGAKHVILQGISGRDYQGSKSKVPVIKADGSTLYLTRDIAAAMHRMDQYKFNKMFYVVENSQTDHFVNLKNILKQMGHEWHSALEHVKFGRIVGMSTRKGTAVLLEDILDEAKLRVLERMKATETTKVSHGEFEQVADILGHSALVINDFKSRRSRHYEFEWEKVLQLKGDSGISLQYAHARLYSLEKNSGHTLDLSRPLKVDTLLANEDAVRLIFTLADFDEAVTLSAHKLEPNVMVSYLFRLSHSVGKAFKTLPVKHCEDEEERNTRLVLFRIARSILAKGMTLLGIRPLNQI
ncbi:putative arginine--tRNA ligase, mitochondrial [Halotydeus destructor]|nr:putative arginine--tRNA ligase, mitochondrial [Halotydeus destructor]